MIVIFIEGVDNSGKTTLAKQLASAFNLNYHHNSKPKTNNPYLEYEQMLDEVKTSTVFDRCYLGEYVYSNLWRGGCSITEKQFADLDLMCLMKFEHVFLIHASAPHDIIKQRCIDNNEQLLKLDEIENCIHLYDNIISKSTLQKIKYNSHYQTPEEIIQQIQDLMK